MNNPHDRIDELKMVLELWRKMGYLQPDILKEYLNNRIKELEAELPEPNLYERDFLGRRPIDIHEAEQWIDDRHLREEL